jgi:branched-subunit amino acid ABC-type transport system permease component
MLSHGETIAGMSVLGDFSWLADPVVLGRQFLAGLASGMLLFLVASGLSLIFGVSRIINFAHGAIFMLGAYIAFTFVSAFGSSLPSFWLAVAAATAGTFLFGCAFEFLFLRRIYRSPQAFQLLVTFGLVLILGDLVRLVWGREENSVPVPSGLDGFVRPFGVTFPVYRLLLIGAGALICFLLWAILYRTRWGKLVRAATVDRDMLQALGTNVRALFTYVFGAGAALAGLAGGLAAPIVSIGPGLHTQVLIDAFVVVVIGGMGSFPGALIGALLVGQANSFGTLAFPELAIVVPFVVMTVLLIVRPWGLMGRPE